MISDVRKPSCRLFQLQEISAPDGCAEVIAFAKSRFTTREQWGFLRAWIEQYAFHPAASRDDGDNDAEFAEWAANIMTDGRV